eukprot:2753239-Alexandrium_andersonii.AAC.1
MTDFIVPRVCALLCEQGPRMNLEDVEKIFRTGRAIQRCAWCRQHNARCEAKTATLHIAGAHECVGL